LDEDGRGPAFDFGDESSTGVFVVEIQRISELFDMVIGLTDLTHVYLNRSKSFEVKFSVCCRVKGNQNSLQGVRLSTLVDLSKPEILGSPSIFMSPFIDLYSKPGSDVASDMESFFVPSTSQQRAPLLWQETSIWEYGSARSRLPQKPGYIGINPLTGAITVNTSCILHGTCVFDSQVVIHVFDGAVYSSVDFIIRLHSCQIIEAPILIAANPLISQNFVNSVAGKQTSGLVQFEAIRSRNNVTFCYDIDLFPSHSLGLMLSREAFMCDNLENSSNINHSEPNLMSATWSTGVPGDHYMCVSVISTDLEMLNKKMSNSCLADGTNRALYFRTLPLCSLFQIRSAATVQELRNSGIDPPKCKTR
jgi:hypothetical protein